MVNINGRLHDDSEGVISLQNRGYSYGDALFETIKVVHGKILFWEDHYFRLMASMRILRMDIPMNFTMEFLEREILNTIDANELSNKSARIRMNVHRISGGKYFPLSNDIEYNIAAEILDSDFYSLNPSSYIVELFKDFYLAPGLLSTLKTNNRIINVLGSIYAKENQYESCLLLNTNKNVVEGLHGNLFLVKDNIVKTPPLEDGCIKGIMRKQLIEIINTMENLSISETSISPFELQQADELFLSNVVMGIQPISSYRKKIYATSIAQEVLNKLNVKIRLG